MELQSIDGCLGCGPKIRSLMLFEVISFAFFLASLLVAYGLKIMISLINAAELNEEFRNHCNRKSIRKVMLCAIFSSILGCLFLILSIVYILQIRLGISSCESPFTVQGVVALVIIVTCGVIFHAAVTISVFLYVWLLVYINMYETLLMCLIRTWVFGFVCIHLLECMTYYECV